MAVSFSKSFKNKQNKLFICWKSVHLKICLGFLSRCHLKFHVNLSKHFWEPSFSTKCSKIIILDNTCFTCRDKNIIKNIYNNIYIYVYICLYIYILYIYGDITSKNKVFFATSFSCGRSQGICQICDLQVLKDIWCHFMTDFSYFRPYAGTKSNGGEQKICMKLIQFRSWFRPSGAKVSSFIIQKFSHCFSLSFNVSVDVMRMFFSCSMIIIFSWLLKSWSCLLKCLQAGIALEFLTSFLWLLSLMLNGVSDLPTYWMLQIWQSSR